MIICDWWWIATHPPYRLK